MAKAKWLSERDQEIQAAAAAGNMSELAVVLHSGFHHGKAGANQAEKRLAASTIRSTFGRKAPDASHADFHNEVENETLIKMIRELAVSFAPSAREVACVLLHGIILEEPFLHDLLLQLATDENWEVREWTAPLFTKILSTDFPTNVPRIREFLAHPHESVRRQVALAIKQTAQQRIPGSVPHLLELSSSLMADESEYVRKNLGPFCIGDGLLRVAPTETLEALRKWSLQEEWAVRWNVAMAFSGAQGVQHLEAAAELLSALADDPRKQVRSAVRKACKNMLKREPEATQFLVWL